MGALVATDAEERLGEAGVTNLVLTLRAAAVKACGGTLVTTRGDVRCCSRCFSAAVAAASIFACPVSCVSHEPCTHQ